MDADTASPAGASAPGSGGRREAAPETPASPSSPAVLEGVPEDIFFLTPRPGPSPCLVGAYGADDSLGHGLGLDLDLDLPLARRRRAPCLGGARGTTRVHIGEWDSEDGDGGDDGKEEGGGADGKDDADGGRHLEPADRDQAKGRTARPSSDAEDWAIFEILVGHNEGEEEHSEDRPGNRHSGECQRARRREDFAEARGAAAFDTGKGHGVNGGHEARGAGSDRVKVADDTPRSSDHQPHHHAGHAGHGHRVPVDDYPVHVLTPERLADDAMAHDVATTLRSELAALQYKRDRLLAELQDMKGQLRCREQRALELQVESDQLREQAARQSSVIASLRKRVQELEERERTASCSLGRSELAVQTLQRESRQAAERVVELEAKLRRLELECHEEEGLKEAARGALSDLVRRLAAALGAELVDASPEVLVVRAAELVQEAGRLRSRASNLCESLQSAELELRNCREALQRQQAAHMCELDRVKQDKDAVEVAHRCTERELAEIREKLAVTSRSLGACTANCAQQESAICALREEVKIREEKWLRLQNELRHLLESMAIMVSSPSRFVESSEGCIKERIREILSDNKDLVVQVDSLRDKACGLQQQLGRQTEIAESSSCRARVLEEDKAILEARLHKAESDLTACDVAREALRRDKCTFMEFLDRLGRALNMQEVSKDIGVEMHTEALLVRADQLARLESDKMVDKLLLSGITLPRLKRPRSPRDTPGKETAAVYQLQRRVRTLREQLQRRDLHLDLLRRKLALQVDSCRARAVVESERDEISLRAKKLQKKVDCLQLQLAEARTLNRDLKAQLADAAGCKITALERARRIEELQKRLMDAEVVRTQYNRKVNILKDQVRATAQSANQERSLGEHAAQLLREDLASAKAALAEAARKESQLVSLRSSVCKLLAIEQPATDYEILARLQKLVAAHRDFTLVSRRWDHSEPLPLPLPVPCTPPPRPLSPPRSARCALAAHAAAVEEAEFNSVLDEIDDINGIYNKRPHRLAS